MFSIAMNTMVAAIRVSISGGNHSASGARPNAEANSVIECATVNAVTMMIERAQPADRNHEAGEKQEMVGAVENVPEALDHEPQHRLVPARVEIDEAGGAVKLEGAYGAVRRHETQARC